MHPVLVLGFLLATSGFATAAGSNKLTPRAQNITTPPSDISNPWGPNEFSISILHRSQPFPPSQFFRTAIGVLSELSQRDFNSMLPRPRMSWYETSAPRLTIAIASTGHNLRLPLRYVL